MSTVAGVRVPVMVRGERNPGVGGFIYEKKMACSEPADAYGIPGRWYRYTSSDSRVERVASLLRHECHALIQEWQVFTAI